MQFTRAVGKYLKNLALEILNKNILISLCRFTAVKIKAVSVLKEKKRISYTNDFSKAELIDKPQKPSS